MITAELLEKYLKETCETEDPVLAEIDRKTHLEVLRPHMVSGHYQGVLLTMVSTMLRPSCILEIGTFTGYSAIALAKGLAADGKLITLENNHELEKRIRANIRRAGMENCIDLRIGDAGELIMATDINPDLVFIDADKRNNEHYVNMIFPKMKSGGVILVDNVLWKGKVLEENMDKDTRCIDEFNKKMASDERFLKIILPVRDGLMMLVKK